MTRALWLVIACVVALTSAAPANQRQPTLPIKSWNVDGESRGLPSADEQSVYFLGKRHEVVAINRADGRLRWRSPTSEPGESTMGYAALVANGVVVAGDYNLMAFDA